MFKHQHRPHDPIEEEFAASMNSASQDQLHSRYKAKDSKDNYPQPNLDAIRSAGF